MKAGSPSNGPFLISKNLLFTEEKRNFYNKNFATNLPVWSSARTTEKKKKREKRKRKKNGKKKQEKEENMEKGKKEKKKKNEEKRGRKTKAKKMKKSKKKEKQKKKNHGKCKIFEDLDEKSSTIPMVCRCCCHFFRRNPLRFSYFLECVFFLEIANNPLWEDVGFRRKVTILIGRDTKSHIETNFAKLTMIILSE